MIFPPSRVASRLLTNTASCVDVANDKVAYLTGRARFVDSTTVSIAPTFPKVTGGSDVERTVTADRIIIAVGGKPTAPTDIEGAVLGFDSDGFFALKELPKRVVVVGAGYIAVELAGIFNALGTYFHGLHRIFEQSLMRRI